MNGFTFAAASPGSETPEICVDIDECSSAHICSEYARCYNRIGGYDCECFPGYEGNGYECRSRREQATIDGRYSGYETTTPTYGGCSDCSENAYCSEGVCICNSGFMGNGRDCRMICALNEVFNGVTCVKMATVEEGELTRRLLEGFNGKLSDEVQPYCTQTGCVCPRGYTMIEYAFKSVCRVEETTDDPEQPSSKLNQFQNS